MISEVGWTDLHIMDWYSRAKRERSALSPFQNYCIFSVQKKVDSYSQFCDSQFTKKDRLFFAMKTNIRTWVVENNNSQQID